MNPRYTNQSGQSILLGELLAQGGEGSVWSVVGRPEVAKIYHPASLRTDQEAKLSIMVANPPSDEMRKQFSHVSITWPTALLYQEAKFSGFLMPRLGESLKILEVYNPRLRKTRYPGFNWKYLVHTALNLSIAVDAIHAKGYVIGDINESNIMVNRQALVSLIDTDSFQVYGHHGSVFRCPVGREEFTPPELQGVQFNSVNRQPEHDYFGLAVMVFLLLMEGNHPFAGVLKTPNPGNDPDNVYCLKQGAFPYTSNSLSAPRPTAPRLKLLPPDIQRLMIKCFVEGYTSPKARPTPDAWVQALEKAEAHLVQCRRDQNHWYSGHLRSCPWCPADSIRLQAPLPAVKPVDRAGTALPQRGGPQPAPASQPVLHSQPAAFQPAAAPTPYSPGSSMPRESLRRFGYRLGVSTRPSLKRWWQKSRLSLLVGMLSGASLSLILELMFRYPATTSWVLAGLAGLIILSALLYLTWLVYNQLLRPDNQFQKPVGLLLSIGSIVLAGGAGYLTQNVAGNLLISYQVKVNWLLIESCLLGLGGGAAVGTYHYFSKPRQNWRAALWLAFLAVLTLLVVGLVGSKLIPFASITK